MAKDSTKQNKPTSDYNNLLSRENDLTYQFGARLEVDQRQNNGPSSDGGSQRSGGSVAKPALKTDGDATDVWIRNFIRSTNWKPKAVGFYINGGTGYAEFANVYVSGTIVVAAGTLGGFDVGADYIRDGQDTMGMASTVTGADDVRFWAGDTFANRGTAAFRVLESGKLYATDVEITGGVIDGATITNLTGTADPVVTPDYVGQMYINTTEERFFLAVATNSYNDWMLLTAVHLTLYPEESELVTVSESITIQIVTGSSIVDNVTVSEDINIFISHRNVSTFDLVTVTEDVSLAVV